MTAPEEFPEPGPIRSSSAARAALIDLAAGLGLRVEQLRAEAPELAEEVDAARAGLCALLRRWDVTTETEAR